jgi:hypothetical protein
MTNASEAFADAAELAWRRQVFACRFQVDNLPRPGTALYGTRLRIYVDTPTGETPWPPTRKD